MSVLVVGKLGPSFDDKDAGLRICQSSLGVLAFRTLAMPPLLMPAMKISLKTSGYLSSIMFASNSFTFNNIYRHLDRSSKYQEIEKRFLTSFFFFFFFKDHRF